HKPYFALWSYKIQNRERFDLLGNSLAVLVGISSPSRSRKLVAWVEKECTSMRDRGLLAIELPPCLFPYIRRADPDWRPRYDQYNVPGEYHNGGVWPFVCGFYVAALVATGRSSLAERKLMALTDLVRPAREARVPYGFNEWFKAQSGKPTGRTGRLGPRPCTCTRRSALQRVARRSSTRSGALDGGRGNRWICFVGSPRARGGLDEDRQRHALAGLGPALRTGGARSPGERAGLLDHARKGQPDAVLSENRIGRAMRPPADSGPVRRRGVRGVGSLPCLSAREATG